MSETKKIDSQILKHVAGSFPTGVTVVTVEDNKGVLHEMTASSFVSVSLDPPLVSFCVQNDISIMSHITEHKILGISILSSLQKEISNQYGGISDEDKEYPTHKIGEAYIFDGAFAWYEVEVANIVAAGDHQLILCKVLDLGRQKEGLPLVYYSGYRTLTETI